MFFALRTCFLELEATQAERLRRNKERKQLKRNTNAEPIWIDAPHLRGSFPKISPPPWTRCAMIGGSGMRRTDGKLLGPSAPKAVRQVLSGLLCCSCGASFEAQSASYGRWKGGVYVCSAVRRKGRAVCASELHLPTAETEREILDRVERELLNANLCGEVLNIAVERLTREAPKTGRLVAEIKRREKRKAEIERLLTRLAVDRDGLRWALEAKLSPIESAYCAHARGCYPLACDGRTRTVLLRHRAESYSRGIR